MRDRVHEGFEELGLKVITPPRERNAGAGIVSFESGRQQEVVQSLMKRNVVVSGRFGSVRASPHFYNVPEEVESLLSALKKTAGA